jgi:hypothetical protein
MQIALKALVGAMKANLRGRDRDIKCCADLGMRPPVHILHYNHGSQTRWKLAEGLAKPAPELQLIDPALGLGVAVIFGLDDIGKSGLLVTGMTTPRCGGGIDRDAVQPGRERRIAPERREPPPHPNPRLLGNIGGELMIVSKAKRQAVDLAAMTLEQFGERRAIALAGQRDQFCIIW